MDQRCESLVHIGRNTTARRIDQPSPGFGNFNVGSIPGEQGPTTGGLPVSFRPLSESCGSLGGQALGLSLQHEVLKREMNQQLVRYHVPAQMQVSGPQARVHEDLRFRGPGGIEAGRGSRGVNSVRYHMPVQACEHKGLRFRSSGGIEAGGVKRGDE